VVAGDNRLLELRRRVQADPASIAFAQLAEEYRRAGENDNAVAVALAGLQFHPDYLSARVTMSRALIELERLDDAERELNIVLKSAPENLAANRALAEVFQKKGMLPKALEQYRKALQLAKYDPDLEQQVTSIETVIAPPPPPAISPMPAAKVEDLFDFDTLLEQLGGRTQPRLKFDPPPGAPPVAPVPSIVERVELREDDADPFSVLERQLRETEQEPIVATPDPDELAEQQLLADLEQWLSAIATDRGDHRNA
jgi:tetratricopeptide (TPR) repeat protein